MYFRKTEMAISAVLIEYRWPEAVSRFRVIIERQAQSKTPRCINLIQIPDMGLIYVSD